MTKKSRKQHVTRVCPATEVEIEFKVILKETHRRTRTKCDERSQTFSYSLDRDFAKVAVWLRTDAAETVFDDLWSDIGDYLDAESEDER